MALRHLCLAFLLVLTYHSSTVLSSSWWNLGLETCSVSSDTCRNCAQLESSGILNDGQSELCSDSTDTVQPIAKGTRQGIITCREQFQNNKWNCATFEGDNLFGRFVNDRVRETAVVFGLTTAGAISALSMACHEQRVQSCPCVFGQGISTTDEEGNNILKGCDSNFDWAYQNFIPFLKTAYSDPNSLEAKVDMHNIEIGARAIQNRTKSCTCHGVSGTCSIQTCFNEVPDVREIGDDFLSKYDGAAQVQLDPQGNLEKSENIEFADPLSEDEFVYIVRSPDFCESDVDQGIPGTRDRECSQASQCNNICCGRGTREEVSIIPVQECKFVSEPKFDIVCSIVRHETITKTLCL